MFCILWKTCRTLCVESTKLDSRNLVMNQSSDQKLNCWGNNIFPFSSNTLYLGFPPNSKHDIDSWTSTPFWCVYSPDTLTLLCALDIATAVIVVQQWSWSDQNIVTDEAHNDKHVFWPNFELFAGRKDPNQMDSTGGYCLQEVHLSQWCVELRDCHVGSDLIRRATLLGNVQPGCESHAATFIIRLHVLVFKHLMAYFQQNTPLYHLPLRWSKQSMRATVFLPRWTVPWCCTSSCWTAGRRGAAKGQSLAKLSQSWTSWSEIQAPSESWPTAPHGECDTDRVSKHSSQHTTVHMHLTSYCG